jgi:alpha-glucosidase
MNLPNRLSGFPLCEPQLREGVKIGNYAVTVRATGFKTAVRENLQRRSDYEGLKGSSSILSMRDSSSWRRNSHSEGTGPGTRLSLPVAGQVGWGAMILCEEFGLLISRCRIFLLGAVMGTVAALAAHAQKSTAILQSPNGQLVVHFAIQAAQGENAKGKLVYSVEFRSKPVIDNSSLALELEGEPPLGADIRITGTDPGRGVDQYSISNAKVSSVRDAYNSLAVHVAEDTGAQRSMTIEARAYNSGIAFRYVLSRQDGIPSIQLHQEDTEFRFPTDAIDWALELPNYRSSFEAEYIPLATSAFSNQGGVASSFLIGLPLLIHEPGTAWMALMEADLEGSTSMYVTNPSGSWAGHWFVSKLSPRWDDPTYAVKSDLPWHSAWRVLLVADNPGRLLESNLLYDLNPPNRLTDTSWIRGGKASWNWWVNDVDAQGNPAFTTENMKYYVDFAARSGFPYMMLDAGWSARDDITRLNGKVDVPALAQYAATKHVKVWLWISATAAKRQMSEAFPLYEKWGIAGVKIDFVDRDDQEGVQFYYDAAREAAEHHLMVDFHGTRTPWGIHRTYPSVMTYEGLLGMENSKVGRRDSPVSRTVYAFTRMLAGPADYTPGGFRNATEDDFEARNTLPMVMGTRAQQLALYVVFWTPFPMVSDSPQAYAGQPSFRFIRDVPVSWDETRVLDGEPGQFITVARRHGEEWDLGSITNWSPRTLRVPLSFLTKGKSYAAEIYEDAADAATQPTHVAIRHQNVAVGDILTLALAPGGGCAIRFVPREVR